MKKLIYFAIMIMAACMTSCRDTPTDLDLDAQWQLMSFEGLTPDVRTYFSFYRHTAQVKNMDFVEATANMTYVKNEKMTLEFPDATYDELMTLYLLPDTKEAPFEFVFTVEQIDSKRLVLRREPHGHLYTFRKF